MPFASLAFLALALISLPPAPVFALPLPAAASAGEEEVSPPPRLHIEARKAEIDEPLPLFRAELLLLAWGDQHTVELPVDGASTEIRLDEKWLCGAWPERCRDVMRAYLFLEAQDRAVLRSDAFPWPGLGRGGDEAVEIVFPRDARVTVTAEGEHRVTVSLRRPQERILRVVEATGPLSGVEVETYRYFTHLNHCGRMAGELLATGETGADGRIAIPDGDFEYAFVFDKPHHILQDPASQWYPNRLITRLERTETLVVLRELEKRPLHLVVTRDGEPVSPIALHGCRSGCPGGTCGACCGPISDASDETGMIRIEDFRPEAWEKVYFVDPAGRPLWEGYPTRWQEELDEPIRVDLAGRWRMD